MGEDKTTFIFFLVAIGLRWNSPHRSIAVKLLVCMIFIASINSKQNVWDVALHQK